jgi:hypothetical protein
MSGSIRVRHGLFTTIGCGRVRCVGVEFSYSRSPMRVPLNFLCVAIAAMFGVPDLATQSLPPLLPDQGNISHLPEISISLPPNVRSETVQGNYFMLGTFGGAGGYINAKPDVVSYRIEASVKGTAAREVKMVLYADGCQTQKFVVLLETTTEGRNFDCEPLPTVTLVGIIANYNSSLNKDVRVEFNYLASWVCAFFGLADCMVPTFKAATVVPQSDGSFSVVLPDFTQDRNEQATESRFKGEFNVILRESKTGNILTFLRPGESTLSQNLPLQSSYPSLIRFEPRKP